MANKTIGQLNSKTTPASADVFVLEDTEDTKKINYDALADAVLNKITSKNYTVAGSSQTLINAINTLNSKVDGNFATKHENITDVERGLWHKYGHVVVCDLVFTVGTVISGNTDVLFTGFPKATNSCRFRIPHGYDNSIAPLVLSIGTDGKIYNQYSAGGVRAGQYEGQFVYFTND